MRKLIPAAVIVAAATASAPAFAAGTYYVRNDTQRPVICAARLPRSEASVAVALRPGGEWSHATERDDPRTLTCEAGSRRQRFRIASGQRYALREDRGGGLWLRTLDGR